VAKGRQESAWLVLPGLALLIVAFLLPIFQMLVLSISDSQGGLTLGHFQRFLGDPFYLGIVWRTLWLSILITLICSIIGFPYAYIASLVSPGLRTWLIVLLIMPLMTSVVVRTFGWMVLLSRNGLIPEFVRSLGFGGRSFSLMHTETAIVVGMVQVLLPFMTISILSVILKIDSRLSEAARTMGCSFFQTMTKVVFPLALPGLVAGSLLVFTLSVSSFITPALLGGVRLPMLATSIYEQVTQTLDWPFAAAQSVLLLAGILIILIPYMKLVSRHDG